MKKTLFVFAACPSGARAFEAPLMRAINELAAASQSISLDMRGRTGNKRYGGYAKSGKGSRYYGEYEGSRRRWRR